MSTNSIDAMAGRRSVTPLARASVTPPLVAGGQRQCVRAGAVQDRHSVSGAKGPAGETGDWVDVDRPWLRIMSIDGDDLTPWRRRALIDVHRHGINTGKEDSCPTSCRAATLRS